jgi:hypothetical protein
MRMKVPICIKPFQIKSEAKSIVSGDCVLVPATSGGHIWEVSKLFLFWILFLWICLGCQYSNESGLAGLTVREERLTENWEANRLSTYNYLSGLIELAHEKSHLIFRKNKSLLVRYPKWSPVLHKRPGPGIRERVIDSYGKGQINEQEYEDLQKQASSLLKRWDVQRRYLSSERIKLRYPR